MDTFFFLLEMVSRVENGRKKGEIWLFKLGTSLLFLILPNVKFSFSFLLITSRWEQLFFRFYFVMLLSCRYRCVTRNSSETLCNSEYLEYVFSYLMFAFMFTYIKLSHEEYFYLFFTMEYYRDKSASVEILLEWNETIRLKLLHFCERFSKHFALKK